MATYGNSYSYFYIHRLIEAHIFLCSEGLKETTLQEQGAHLMPRSWFLMPISKKKKPKLPGEMTDSRTGPGSMQDKPGWSILQCREARKCPNKTTRTHTDGACQRGQGPHREPHGWNGLCHKSSKVILGYTSSVE